MQNQFWGPVLLGAPKRKRLWFHMPLSDQTKMRNLVKYYFEDTILCMFTGEQTPLNSVGPSCEWACIELCCKISLQNSMYISAYQVKFIHRCSLHGDGLVWFDDAAAHTAQWQWGFYMTGFSVFSLPQSPMAAILPTMGVSAFLKMAVYCYSIIML